MTPDFSFIGTALIGLLPAVPTTLLLTAIPVLIGLLFGTGLALVRLYKVPVLNPLAAAYVTFIRGTPMITHLFLVNYGLPLLIDSLSPRLGLTFHSSSIPIIWFALIAFSITASAYLSEVVRAGMLAVDRGQLEAAYSIGMTPWQGMRRIVFPQAISAALPNLTHSVIGSMHATTLAFYISVVEINGQASILTLTNWKFFDAYIAAALIYWLLTLAIERVAGWAEKRIQVHNRGGVA